MCDFKPGDEVVCIITAPMPWLAHLDYDELIGIVVGEHYTVAHVGPDPFDGEIVVFLNETGNFNDHGVDCGYYPLRFRKVQRRNVSAWLETATAFEGPTRAPAAEPA